VELLIKFRTSSIWDLGLLIYLSIRLLQKHLCFAGHCFRSKQPIRKLPPRDHPKVVRCACAKGASDANHSRQLLKAIGEVNGLVTSDKEVEILILDREAWRSRISMRVKANKSMVIVGACCSVLFD
jgi:hypothetical protein